MRSKSWMLILSASLLAGCASKRQPPAPPPPADPPPAPLSTGEQTTPAPVAASVQNPAPQTADTAQVIASVGGLPITREQFITPLIEGYGLDVLFNVALLEQSRQLAERAKVSVSPQDIQEEHEQTLAKTFPEAQPADYPQLLTQLLQSQGRSRAEWDLVIRTNAYLRAVVEPAVKNRITDDQTQEAFKALYGETAQTRHIELSNLTEVAEAKRKLAAGEKFEDVAKAMSRNDRTAGLGGELLPFSRQATNIPDIFKEAAFSLKEGEISDAVQVNGAYHLIKLEKRIAPKAIKYDDVKESLKLDLEDRLLQVQIRAMRDQLKQQLRAMKINDPVLARQFEQKLAEEDGKVTDRQQVIQKLEEERKAREAAAATQPATQPTTQPEPPTQPMAQPATQPATQPAATQPPSTQPVATVPDTQPATQPRLAVEPASKPAAPSTQPEDLRPPATMPEATPASGPASGL